MLSRNATWSIAGSALPAAAGLISIPALIHLLDLRHFSLTSLLLSIAIFFFVYDFGIGRTVTYFTSRAVAEQARTLNKTLGEALFWSLLIGAIAVLLVIVFSDAFVSGWLHTANEHHVETALAFKVAAWAIPASILAHLLRGLLEGHQDFQAANICKMISGSSLFLAPLVGVLSGHASLVEISSVITISRYFALLVYLHQARRFLSLREGGSIPDLLFTPNIKGPFVQYGIWTAVAGFISSMFVYGDRFVVAGYLDPQALSIYVASQDILIRYLLLPWAMSTVLLPQLIKMTLASDNAAALYRDHQGRIRWLSLAFLVLVMSMVWLISPLVNQDLMPADARWMVSIQAVGIFFCALAQLPLIYLYATGKPKGVAAIFIVEALLYLMIAPAVFERYSAVGACFVWTGRLALEYLLLSHWARSSMK